MERRTRNSKGQFSYIPTSDIYSDLANIEIRSIGYYLWFFAKCVVLFVIIYPFIDKVRQKDFFSNSLTYLSHLDIGCKQCNCPKTVNVTNGNGNQKTPTEDDGGI